MPSSLLLTNARIATCDGPPDARLGVLERAALVTEGDRIVSLGPAAALSIPRGARVIDAGGRLVTPGLVDPHTHLVFAGSRAAEFEKKMAGVDYRTIAAEGGGIMATVRATRAAGNDLLRELAGARLRAMLERGVTTVEVKSGYGLSLEDELRILRIGKNASGGPRTTTTVLGLHAIPPEHAADRAGYVRLVAEELVPRAKAEGLADAVDVYLDANAFSVEESRIVLEAGKRAGLRVRAHVGQFADLGGAQLVAALGGLSCDHLEVVSDEGLRAMAAASTTAVLLPGAWRTLRQKAPDAARMRALGVRVAVGTDLNPGTSPALDLPLMAALAVRDAGLSPREALLSITAHAAAAIGEPEAGVLRVSGRADWALWDHDDPAVFAYALGAVRPAKVAVGGELRLDTDTRAPLVS